MNKKITLSLASIVATGILLTGCAQEEKQPSEPQPTPSSSSTTTSSPEGPWDTATPSEEPSKEAVWVKEKTKYAEIEIPDDFKKISDEQWESPDGKTKIIFSDVPDPISKQGIDAVLTLVTQQATGVASSEDIKTFPTNTENSDDARNIKVDNTEHYAEGVVATKDSKGMAAVLVVTPNKETFTTKGYERIVNSFILLP